MPKRNSEFGAAVVQVISWTQERYIIALDVAAEEHGISKREMFERIIEEDEEASELLKKITCNYRDLLK